MGIAVAAIVKSNKAATFSAISKKPAVFMQESCNVRNFQGTYWHKNRSLFQAPNRHKRLAAAMQVLEKIVSALSVTPTCPHCKGVIPSEDVNVANDIAFCRKCDLSQRLSDLTLGTTVDEDVDASRPPDGTWFQRDMRGVVVGATHRSLGQAFGLLLFSLFWNGIVSVFVAFAVASTLKHLGVTLPHWFPAPTSKGSAVGVGMTIFLWLFLTPFIAVGLGMLMTFLSCLAGKTELQIQGGQGVIFTGIGSLGFRKRFSTSEIQHVRIEDKRWRDSDGTSHRNARIVIETNRKPINFGSMLTDERRRFVAGCVKKELVRR